jgi:hypothetical protein
MARWLQALRCHQCAAWLGLITLTLASCAGHPHVRPATTAGAAAGQLRIAQVRVGNARPVEGSIGYVRVDRAAGGSITQRRLPAGHTLTLRLVPGTYRLVSWQRLCDGNCGHLDPPSNRCTRPFTMSQRERLEATIRVNFPSGCVIALRH